MWTILKQRQHNTLSICTLENNVEAVWTILKQRQHNTLSICTLENNVEAGMDNPETKTT